MPNQEAIKILQDKIKDLKKDKKEYEEQAVNILSFKDKDVLYRQANAIDREIRGIQFACELLGVNLNV